MLFHKIKKRIDKYVLPAVPESLYKKLFISKPKQPITVDEANSILHQYRLNRVTSGLFQPHLGKTQKASEKVDLTIIVPCYNVEQYVEQCLDSILSQTTTYRYLVVIVDDGSTDNTPNILNKYRDHDPVFIISQKNAGQGNARNTALNLSNSRYIMFVDSDDYLEDNSIQRLLDTAFSNNADIVEGGFRNFNGATTIYTKQYQNGKYEYDPERITGFPWGKVIRSSLFDSVRFVENAVYEDTIGHYLLYPKSKTICLIDGLVYHYRKNNNGIMRSKTKDYRQLDGIYVTVQLVNDSISSGIDLEYLYRITLRQIVTNYSRIYFMNLDIQLSVFVITCDLCSRFFAGMHTDIAALEPLERSIRTRDFAAYYRYMKIHG